MLPNKSFKIHYGVADTSVCVISKHNQNNEKQDLGIYQ